MRKTALVFALLFASPASATSTFYTFQTWAAADQYARLMYIAGAMDSYLMFSGNNEEALDNHHISLCMQRAGMTSGQLATNILNYGRANPKLHAATVQQVMGMYLREVCGARKK